MYLNATVATSGVAHIVIPSNWSQQACRQLVFYYILFFYLPFFLSIFISYWWTRLADNAVISLNFIFSLFMYFLTFITHWRTGSSTMPLFRFHLFIYLFIYLSTNSFIYWCLFFFHYLLVNSTGLPTMPLGICEMRMADGSYTLAEKGAPGIGMLL